MHNRSWQGNLEIDGQQLPCTDKFGNLLSARVQIVRDVRIPPDAESSVTCRLTNAVPGQQGLIEGGTHSKVAVAACVATPAPGTYRLPVRCYNPAAYAITLTAGSVIGNYVAIDESQIFSTSDDLEVNLLTTSENSPKSTAKLPSKLNEVTITELNPHLCSVPEHVKALYLDATANCSSPEECKEVAQLLNAYSDVFSSGSDDMGLTDLVTHSIPVLPGMKPIKQPPRRLGPHRDQEVE